jgi:hypothetical protein
MSFVATKKIVAPPIIVKKIMARFPKHGGGHEYRLHAGKSLLGIVENLGDARVRRAPIPRQRASEKLSTRTHRKARVEVLQPPPGRIQNHDRGGRSPILALNESAVCDGQWWCIDGEKNTVSELY